MKRRNIRCHEICKNIWILVLSSERNYVVEVPHEQCTLHRSICDKYHKWPNEKYAWTEHWTMCTRNMHKRFGLEIVQNAARRSFLDGSRKAAPGQPGHRALPSECVVSMTFIKLTIKKESQESQQRVRWNYTICKIADVENGSLEIWVARETFIQLLLADGVLTVGWRVSRPFLRKRP